VTFAKSVNFLGTLVIATLLVASGSALARDGQRKHGASAPHATQPHTRTTERQRTENGRTRSTTVTNKDGETATRGLTVSGDKEAGTVARESNYTTLDGREGSKSDVIQRTDDGFTRDTVRTLPNGETHTRAVDVSCDKDAAKCVKQVEVGQQ
jgi:hypothetical protein